MAADLTSSFAIETEADSSATDELAASLEKVHDRMVQDQKAVADLNAGLRRLKGDAATSTEEVKRLKDELAAKKAAMAASQVEFVKLGGSMSEATKRVDELKTARRAQETAAAAAAADSKKRLDEQQKAQAAGQKAAAEEAKRAAEEARKVRDAAAQKAIADAEKMAQAALKTQSKQREDAKKSVEDFLKNQRKEHTARVERMQTAVKERQEALRGANVEVQASRMIGEAFASVGVIVGKAAVAIYAALAAAAAAFVWFGVQAANAARSARLLREATTGSAAGAEALDKQISALAGRLPGTRAEIEQIGLALVRAGLSGAPLEHAFSAVATASAVMGSQVGGVLQGLIERAKMSKRFFLGAFDLKGTGLQIADVAQALSKRLKISFQQAMAAIQNGQVGMEAGIAALGDAVQKKWGKIGKLMALDLGKQLDRAKDNFGQLFKGLHIEPALEALADLLSILDENTATGQGLKTIFEALLNPLLDMFTAAAPAGKSFLKGAIYGALVLTLELMKLKKSVKEALGPSTFGELDLQKVFGLGAFVVGLFGIALTSSIRAAVGLVEVVSAVGDAISAAWDAITSVDLKEVGTNILKGLADAIKSGVGIVTDAIAGVADKIVSAFKASMIIRSPSRRMKPLGRQVPAGVAEGIEEGGDELDKASEAMARRPARAMAKASNSGGGGAGAHGSSSSTGPLIGVLNIYGVDNADKLTEPSLLDKLADALDRARRQGGASLVEVTA